jgi:hypothetical protein
MGDDATLEEHFNRSHRPTALLRFWSLGTSLYALAEYKFGRDFFLDSLSRNIKALMRLHYGLATACEGLVNR